MTQIKSIVQESAIGQVGRKQIATTKAAEADQTKQTGSQVEQSDSLQIDRLRSQEAQFIEDARLLLDELPDVRQDRVEAAKRRLQSGYYDQPEVLAKTAEKMLSAEQVVPPKAQPSTEKLDQVRERLDSGFYERKDVLNVTAERILKENS